MKETRRVIITGGPGTGKSTLINILEQRGFNCKKEVARAVIQEQLKLETNLVPWQDLSGFSRIVFDKQIQQYKSAEKNTLNFYDRGMVDVTAYLKYQDIDVSSYLKEAENYPYYPTVFITPPWKEIYAVDNERVEPFEMMVSIHTNLTELYKGLGYNVLEVPKTESHKRIDFILNTLGIE
jgi:predicted ATPase